MFVRAMPALALKLLLAPSLVAGVSLAGRRWGTNVAGLLAGLPIVAGPVLFFIAFEQGPAFGARAAVSTTLGIMSLMSYCLTYAWSARRTPWWLSMLLGWITFLVCTVAFEKLRVGPVAAALVVAGVLSVTLLAMPPGAPSPPAARPAWWDVPTRMALTASLVLALTAAAQILGPRWSGLLTPFPIATTVLATFAHRQGGPAAAARFLRGLLSGLYSFITFNLVVALTIEHSGVGRAFALASLASLGLHALLFAVTSRRRQAA
jgi:hypothetical protein